MQATSTADTSPGEAFERALHANTVCEAFQITAAARAEQVAVRTPDDSVSLTYGALAERVRRVAAGLAALGQGRAVGAAVEAIARNPGAVGDIRGSLLLGLVLIESLAIYVLLISLILFFLYPFGSKP
jgi:F0F1-type ATP synthase membrane subunit c/vacuolar-type H+-ATPase subunit K